MRGGQDRAVAYLRVSTDDQRLGPAAQRQQIEAWAQRVGCTVVAWHEDHGVSGATPPENRPALLAALADLGAHQAGLLVVAKRDRLARSVLHAAMIEQLARSRGARVQSAAGEGTDGDEHDPAAELMRTMIDAFAQFERAMIRSRTRAALGVKRARGERVGTVPYGYRVGPDGVALVCDPAEQAVVQRVRDGRAQGRTFRALVAELARDGVVGRTSRPLALMQLQRIVKQGWPVG